VVPVSRCAPPGDRPGRCECGDQVDGGLAVDRVDQLVASLGGLLVSVQLALSMQSLPREPAVGVLAVGVLDYRGGEDVGAQPERSS
jgi:hypothetical protein